MISLTSTEMALVDRLRKCDWNDFERYPIQGSAIFVKVIAVDNNEEKFFAINKFNASLFDPKIILSKLPEGHIWDFYWVYNMSVIND